MLADVFVKGVFDIEVEVLDMCWEVIEVTADGEYSFDLIFF